MSEQQITVTEFRKVAEAWLAEFESHWSERRITVPDLFPDKLSVHDWGDQFSTWAETTYDL